MPAVGVPAPRLPIWNAALRLALTASRGRGVAIGMIFADMLLATARLGLGSGRSIGCRTLGGRCRGIGSGRGFRR